MYHSFDHRSHSHFDLFVFGYVNVILKFCRHVRCLSLSNELFMNFNEIVHAILYCFAQFSIKTNPLRCCFSMCNFNAEIGCLIAKRTKSDIFYESWTFLFFFSQTLIFAAVQPKETSKIAENWACHAFMCGTIFWANILNWCEAKIRKKYKQDELKKKFHRTKTMAIKAIHSLPSDGSLKVLCSRQFSELIFFLGWISRLIGPKRITKPR